MLRSTRRLGAIIALGTLPALALAGLADAHVVKDVGPYSVTIGWVQEPVYIGEQNAVQVIVKDATGHPVDDLSADDLQVVISTAGTDSEPMALEPTFDEDTSLGVPGDYEAPIIPTALGEYTFHVTGSIHGTPLDEKVTSSKTTFDDVVAPTTIQFPTALPPLDQVVTRIERTDGRAAQAQTAADDAKGAASLALIIGAGSGGLGVLVGLAGVALAIRNRPRVTADP